MLCWQMSQRMPTSGIQTTTGKAFEYACMLALQNQLQPYCPVSIVMNAPYVTARNAFYALDTETNGRYYAGACAAVTIIKRLEPQLTYNKTELTLALQSDSKGQGGDVRDVLCMRSNEWEIGFSCKHNHEAVKHSRLSDTIDFGNEWFGIPCSLRYFDEVRSVFTPLRRIRDESKTDCHPALWEEMDDKEDRCYVPVLNAFMNEMKRIDRENPRIIPEALIRYLIGMDDFYKVIMNEGRRYTKIEAINIYGTLNRSVGNQRALVDVPRLKLPTRFIEIGYKENSKNTIEIYCDGGWNVSMRIHNASKHIEPSLKFDVQLMAMPSSILTQIEPW